ncbi:UvrD-helicase domain-containing protein [Clostridium sp.]|uniref:UvrD-helicase domain-containing protein n=1 Tax=Clostridium sp. TaxID=1506 RepID=UPI002637AAB3|nr:UvrD-helicase domain-containing protein [Clostridium sp.]
MVDGKIENVYLINAPAGSGKTTKIKSMLLEHITCNPRDNILCITYTNRAAEELQCGINNNKIFFGTIHSFINSFISVFFTHKDILDLYWEVYKDQIDNRIKNLSYFEHIAESNQKYINKYGSLDCGTIKNNIKKISYNETSFNSLFYGGLSHDDLISFAKIVVDRYPIIKNKISKKYQAIFIDEYQDTSSDVLNLFFDAVKNTDTKLYLLGDKMQQIYRNYDGAFEKKFEILNTEIALKTNHRSIGTIVNILNKLYNDKNYYQEPDENNKDVLPDYSPQIAICKKVENQIEQIKHENPNTLILFLLNKNKFKEIGCENLYNSFNRMEKYSFSRKYKATDIITDSSPENPDPLMRILFLCHKAISFFMIKQYGNIINLCRSNQKFLNYETCIIRCHSDKQRIKFIWEEISKIYNDDTNIVNIEEFLNILKNKKIINNEYLGSIYEMKEYETILAVSINEFRVIASYIEDPHISTQHGVKGESHDTVLFVADDSQNTPIVYMYKFFEIWSKYDFSLKDFEKFYYDYYNFIINVEKELGINISNLNAELHNKNEKNKELLKRKSLEILETFRGNILFEYLCKESYNTYLSNPTVGNIKKCFKDGTVYGVLSAYRLFYVGCSRARRNLTVLVSEDKISNFRELFINRAKTIGFHICER